VGETRLIDAGGAGPEGALNMTASAAGDAGGARFEVLVGWSAQDFGGRIVLRTETFEGGQQHRPEQPMHTHVFMTREQATLLANYLFLLTGQSRPEPRRKKKSWFGGKD
jgi:hypothetical protein